MGTDVFSFEGSLQSLFESIDQRLAVDAKSARGRSHHLLESWINRLLTIDAINVFKSISFAFFFSLMIIVGVAVGGIL